MISALIEKPRLAGVPYLVTDPIGPEAEERVRRGGRPILHLPRGRALTRRERKIVARVRGAELDHLNHPDRWAARKRRQYEIDSLAERYRDVIRGAPVGPVYHGTGALVGTPSPLAPMAILAADGVTVEQFCHGDLDVAISTGVSGWGDLATVGPYDYSQSTAADQPAYVERAASIGYRNYLDFDGSSDFLQSSLGLPAPSARTSWLWLVWLQDSWSTNRRIVSDTTINPNLAPLQETASSTVKLRSSSATGVNQITTFGLDVWGELVAYSSDSAADYLKVGADTATGTSSGTGTESTGTGRRIAANPGGSPTVWTDMYVAAIMYAQSNPSDNARAALRNWDTQFYGSAVLV